MPGELMPSDDAILDLLRRRGGMNVTEFAAALGVTATAVRQRLVRLRAQGFIDRELDRTPRGRPRHQYVMTAKGRRQAGANFGDLAMALWMELRAIPDPQVRVGLVQRLSRRLAEQYSDQVEGTDLATRLEGVAALFNDRQIPFEVEEAREPNQLPVLTALACPYPELAEQDRSVCTMERMLFSELVGEKMTLSKCRLDGEPCCTFEVQPPAAVAASGPSS